MEKRKLRWRPWGLWILPFWKARVEQSSQPEKAPSLHVLTLGGSLIPSNLLPAHFLSALTDVCRHGNTWILAVFVSIYLFICLCGCALFNLCCILLIPPWSPFCLSCMWAARQLEHITWMKGPEVFFVFFLLWEEHLNCMSWLLCSDFALEG